MHACVRARDKLNGPHLSQLISTPNPNLWQPLFSPTESTFRCMYHNSKGGGLHVSTNSKTNRAKSDTYAICKRDIPGAGQIKALAAYVKVNLS